MAADLMPRLDAGMERGFSLLANGTQFARTTRVKDTAFRRLDGARNFALQAQTRLDLVAEARDCGEQSGCIGMMGAGEDGLGGANLEQGAGEEAFGGPNLDQPAEIQHRDSIGQIAHTAEVVGNEQVTDLMLHLQFDQQIENRRLYR